MKSKAGLVAIMTMAFMLTAGVASAAAAEFKAEDLGQEVQTTLGEGNPVVFHIQGTTISCQGGGNGATKSLSSPTFQFHQYHLEHCVFNQFQEEPRVVNNAGCKFMLHANGVADLEQCESGGIQLEWNNGYLFKCAATIPNQSGLSGVAYTNNTEHNHVKVEQNLSMKANLVKTGACPWKAGEGMPITYTATFTLESLPAFWVG